MSTGKQRRASQRPLLSHVPAEPPFQKGQALTHLPCKPRFGNAGTTQSSGLSAIFSHAVYRPSRLLQPRVHPWRQAAYARSISCDYRTCLSVAFQKMAGIVFIVCHHKPFAIAAFAADESSPPKAASSRLQPPLSHRTEKHERTRSALTSLSHDRTHCSKATADSTTVETSAKLHSFQLPPAVAIGGAW